MDTNEIEDALTDLDIIHDYFSTIKPENCGAYILRVERMINIFNNLKNASRKNLSIPAA